MIEEELIFLDSIPLQLLLVVVLIFINAFFASSEIAVISLNKTKLRFMAEDGDKVAKRLLKLAETPTGFLSTIQIGITLAGFLNSAFAADNFAGRIVNWIYYDLQFQAISEGVLKTLAVIVVTIILSYFQLVLGELVPKRLAMQKSYSVAKITSFVIVPLAVIMKPFIWFLTKSTNVCLRILRLKVEAEEDSVTEEEIKMMVDLGEETGTVEEKEKEWIENIFDFNDTTVKEIMTPTYAVTYLLETDTRDKIDAIIKQTKFSRYPVCKTNLNDIIGVLHIKDYFLNPNKDVKDILRPAYLVPETTLADDLFNKLKETKNTFAAVIDEYGNTSGILTMEDLLEEIVGKIYDEHDKSDNDEFVEVEPGRYLVSGEMNVSDLAEKLDVSLEDSEAYDTVGGLILSCLDYVPSDGSSLIVTKDELVFEVIKVLHRRIVEVIVTKKSNEQTEENNLPNDTN